MAKKFKTYAENLGELFSDWYWMKDRTWQTTAEFLEATYLEIIINK